MMADEQFTNNLLRAVAAELHVLTGMTAARCTASPMARRGIVAAMVANVVPIV
jgi:hypothetical protein